MSRSLFFILDAFCVGTMADAPPEKAKAHNSLLSGKKRASNFPPYSTCALVGFFGQMRARQPRWHLTERRLATLASIHISATMNCSASRLPCLSLMGEK